MTEAADIRTLPTFPLSDIRIDGGTQMRVEIDEATVAAYAEAMESGVTFPPVVLFEDGVNYWLSDGFHRYHSARRAGKTGHPAEIRIGTRRDAILYAVGTNAEHGKPRTNADKRRAVMLLLEDEEWQNKGSGWLAEKARVSDRFVRKVKQELGLSRNNAGIEVKRGDSIYTMAPPQRTTPPNSPAPPQEDNDCDGKADSCEGDSWYKDEENPRYNSPAAQTMRLIEGTPELTKDFPDLPPDADATEPANVNDNDCDGKSEASSADRDGKSITTTDASGEVEGADTNDDATFVDDDEDDLPYNPNFDEWPAEERVLLAQLQQGQSVVVNITTHRELIAYAQAMGQFVYVGRGKGSNWGNPYILGPDGDRATVCINYEQHYLAYKPSLLEKLPSLKGKALGCYCSPERCHADTLAAWANNLPDEETN